MTAATFTKQKQHSSCHIYQTIGQLLVHSSTQTGQLLHSTTGQLPRLPTRNYWAATKIAREELYVEGGTHQHHLQVLESRQHLFEGRQQEVAETVTLMDLILGTKMQPLLNCTHQALGLIKPF